MKENSDRKFGIDLLRVIGTLFVIIIHIAPAIQTIEMSSAYIGQKFLVALVEPCINIFALISGYLCWDKQLRPGKIINLHIIVLFYSIMLTIIAAFLVELPKSEFIYSFVPLLSARYWYFSAYIGMCFFIPIINASIKQIGCKEGVVLILGLLFAFTILTMFKDGRYFGIGIQYGYSTMWLCVLYFIGGVISKFKLNNLFYPKRWFLIWGICYFITVAWIFLTNLLLTGDTREWIVTFLVRYSSPTVATMGICLMGFFCNITTMEKKCRKLIFWLSDASFGVYIIGAHWAVMRYIVQGRIFDNLKEVNGLFLILGCVIGGIILHFGFAVIDSVRKIFFRNLHIDKIGIYIERKLNNYFSSKLYNIENKSAEFKNYKSK